MRKMSTMGEHASLVVVEDAVRLVEGDVLSELEKDETLKKRMARARIESQSAVDLVQDSEDILTRLSLRLKTFRDNNPTLTPEMDKALSQAFVMQSKLSMKASNTLTDLDRESLLTNLAEAQKISADLKGVGSQRNDILLHALNGLANAKIAKATGVPQRPEVTAQLFNLLTESQSLEVPHSNAQVRLDHCLKICERIVARNVSDDDIAALQGAVGRLEAMSPTGEPGSPPDGDAAALHT